MEMTLNLKPIQPASWHHLDPDLVDWWATTQGMNTSTQHTFNECARELYNRLFGEKQSVEGLFDTDSDENALVVVIE